MTAREIMKLDADGRLDVEAKAKTGNPDAVRDWVMISSWRKIKRSKGMDIKNKTRAFVSLFSLPMKINVETV